jgi:hypothetical protein
MRFKSFKTVKICLLIKISKKILVLKFYFATIISVQFTQHFYEKREGYGAGSVLVTYGSGSGCGCGSGSSTL